MIPSAFLFALFCFNLNLIFLPFPSFFLFCGLVVDFGVLALVLFCSSKLFLVMF